MDYLVIVQFNWFICILELRFIIIIIDLIKFKLYTNGNHKIFNFFEEFFKLCESLS